MNTTHAPHPQFFSACGETDDDGNEIVRLLCQNCGREYRVYVGRDGATQWDNVVFEDEACTRSR